MIFTKELLNALEFALHCHKDKTYGNNLPYVYHLIMAYHIGEHYKYLLPIEYQNDSLAATLLHDSIEDAGITYNDVKNATNENIANIVYDVTNELGKNRKERNLKTYPKIKNNPLAKFVKLCDRIANASYSTLCQSTMLDAYKKEYPKFKQKLYVIEEYEDMWKELDKLLN